MLSRFAPHSQQQGLSLIHISVQIIGGIVLHRACIAEMQTGEGKTLVLSLIHIWSA